MKKPIIYGMFVVVLVGWALTYYVMNIRLHSEWEYQEKLVNKIHELENR